MDQKDEPGGCACGSRQSDLLRAPPPKKDWLRKTACPRCGKVYWTDKDTDYCMDCEPLTVTSSSRGGSS
ncbi:MAG: hypothetical protein ACLP5V_12200 [Candidatus Bathyarchaeia archaeon]